MTSVSKYAEKYLIILVDDEEISLKYFRREFSSKFNIVTTTNPEEVLEIINSRPGEVALVISDQRMGHIKGVDLLTLIKAKDPEIVRVLTTAYASLEDNIEAINKGNVFAYLMKPWSIEYVEDVINRSLDEFGKRKNYLSLSSSIASEMRTPLKTASKSAEIIRSKLKNYKNGSGGTSGVSENDLDDIVRLSNDLSSLAMRGNIIIDTILDSFESKTVDTASFHNFKVSHILNSALLQFEDSKKDKTQVNFTIKGDEEFEFRCNDILFGYAIYILLTNIVDSGLGVSSVELAIKKGIGGFNRIEVSADQNFSSDILAGFNMSFDFGKRVIEDFSGKVFYEDQKIIIELPKVGRLKEEGQDSRLLIVGSNEIANKLEKHFSAFIEGFECRICDDFEQALHEAKEEDFDLIVVENKKEFFGFWAKVRDFDSLTAVLSLVQDSEENVIGDVDGVVDIDKMDNRDFRSVAKWGMVELLEKYYEVVDFKNVLKGRKILLADDEHFNLILGSKFFVDLGVEVEEVRDGLLAIEQLKKEKYDLALIDINMPNLSGIDVVKKLREIEEISSSTPVIAFTADDDKVRVREILKAGFDDYFIKSTKYNNLARLMSIYLQ